MFEFTEDTQERVKFLGELLRQEGQAPHADDIAAALAELDRRAERIAELETEVGWWKKVADLKDMRRERAIAELRAEEPKQE